MYFAVGFTIPIMIISMAIPHTFVIKILLLILTAPVIFVFGKKFFINAFKQLRHGLMNMDTLIAFSTGISFLFSIFNTFYSDFFTQKGIDAHVYFEASATIISFILIGKYLEAKAKQKTNTAIKDLLQLTPKTVLKINSHGEAQETDISEVKSKDILIAKPGDRIAVDGIITSGFANIDESMISGEYLPVEKQIDSQIFAGTINKNGVIKYRATKVGNDTLIAQMIKIVKEAQGSKAPIQKIADKVASIFVPTIFIISILTFIIWMIFAKENAFSHALVTSITVLVIACPCALGLATPTAIMIGIGRGASNNILIKDAESLQLLDKTDAIVFDKTGTITEGKPIVNEIIWFIDDNKDFYQTILYNLENNSQHPLSKATVAKLYNPKAKKLELSNIKYNEGKGIEGIYNSNKYITGNNKILFENGIMLNSEVIAETKKISEKGSTFIYFAENRKILAVVSFSDKVKSGTKKCLENLKQNNIDIYMLTGDNEKNAKKIAEETGIINYKANMLPTEKSDYIKELQSKGKIVAMVGDGINDSQALALADVSIAMGKGSDIAIDVAKITLTSSDLNLIPKAINLSKNTMKIIKQNLFWAFIYNIIGIPIAAGILYPTFGFLLNPMIAAAAMALSSVSVVSNSLRLKTMNI
ncbi:MAG: copper-translocating P-type ATPase [Saprospiraceae bacterium]